jgi:hypothetical protein
MSVDGGLREPDLTGYSEREIRIFTLGANWVAGAVLEICADAARRTSGKFRDWPAGLVGEAVARAMEEVGVELFIGQIKPRADR